MNLPPGVTNRIILVRHGEPVAAAKGRCYGKLDVGLSANGKRQIEEVARFLQSFELAAVYASPRSRAREIALLIAQAQNLPIAVCEDLAEIDFGDFEGLAYEEVREQFPSIYEQWMNAPTTVEFPNGESFGQMQQRVLQAIGKLRSDHPCKPFAVVSHGGTNRIVLGDCLALESGNIFRLAQDYAALNVIDFYDDFPVIKTINQTTGNLWR